MDAKRAEYLYNVALTQQRKEFVRWTTMAEKNWDCEAEAHRLECAAWADAANTIYRQFIEPRQKAAS